MKNEYEIRGEITAIFINVQGEKKETIIDTKDLPKAQEIEGSWFGNYAKNTDSYYVVTRIPTEIKGKQKTYYLHRWLTEADRDKFVDHFNNDTLDNRRSENLRVVTRSGNGQNRTSAHKNSKSKVRGVYKFRGKWKAQFKLNGKMIYVGMFDDLKEAEKAIKKARAQYMPYSKEALTN